MEYGLTDREAEILWAVAHFGDQTVAAHELGIKIQTIKNTLTTIRQKMGAVSTLQAYYKAIHGRRFRLVTEVTSIYEEDPE